MLEISKEEAKILKMAMTALDDSARSDEPHVAFTPEFVELRKKIWEFLKS